MRLTDREGGRVFAVADRSADGVCPRRGSCIFDRSNSINDQKAFAFWTREFKDVRVLRRVFLFSMFAFCVLGVLVACRSI